MKTILHKFIEFIPNDLEQDVLYISVEYRTAVHLCVCGCGNKVVTPLSPTDWELRFDGKTVSLSPSIGNWNFECKSHYIITQNKIRYARRWEDWEIEEGRKEVKENKESFFKELKWKKKIKSDANTSDVCCIIVLLLPLTIKYLRRQGIHYSYSPVNTPI